MNLSWKTESELSLIVAVDLGGGFAKDGEIPWNFKEDWEHFKAKTKGNVCIMGRKTYEDIVARKKNAEFEEALPGRDVYVVSSTLAGTVPQGTKGAFASTRQILDEIKIPIDSDQEIYILGGYRLYIQHLANAKQIWMTIVPDYYDCDRKFPVDKIDNSFTIVEGHEENGLKFVRYARNVYWYELSHNDINILSRVQMHFMGRNVIERSDPNTRTILVNQLTPEEYKGLEMAGVKITAINKTGE